MESDRLIRERVLTVAIMEGSRPAEGARISHEAIYTWIYALPKGELARLG